MCYMNISELLHVKKTYHFTQHIIYYQRMKPFITLSVVAALLAASASLSARDPESYLSTPMPRAWSYQPDRTPQTPADDNWWSLFNDNILDSLITLASDANFNLKEAAHRRDLARIAVNQARSAYYPQLSLTAGYSRERTSAVNTNQFNLGAQMSWEIDVFGKVAASVKAKKASFHASKAEYNGAMLSMAAEMATYYINYRILQTHVSIAEEHLHSQGEVVKIAEARHEAGLVSKLDVAQAKTVFLSTQSTIPSLRSQMRSTLTAMATLLGEYTDSLAPVMSDYAPLPAYDMLLTAGVPADLLRRRPDIIAAEAQLAASAAAIGIAQKEFLPTLSLTGEIGTLADKTSDMFGRRGFHYTVAPTLSWTVFDGLSRTYGVQQAREQMENAIDDYNLTVLTAVGEVDNAMVAYHTSLETLDITTALYEQSNEAFVKSIDLYKQGLTPFTNVADSQIDLLNASNSMISAKGNALIALIDLYKALGGSPNP